MLDWITQHVPPWVYLALVIFSSTMGLVAYLILLERKVASWTQDRVGPNRVGFHYNLPFMPKFHFWGLGQPMADGLKFFVKEDYRPGGVDKILFTLAPMIMIITVILSICVIPWGGLKATPYKIDVTQQILAGATDQSAIDNAIRSQKLPFYATVLTQPAPVIRYETIDSSAAALSSSAPADRAGKQAVVHFAAGWRFQIADLNIGALAVLSTLSLAVYGVVIGGWASNNKYSFLGGLRATANMISYEIPLGLSVLVLVLMFGTLDLAQIVDDQARYWWGFFPAWNIFAQPMAFVLFLICIHAEANRAPFDLAEAEQELVGGYHTEYSSMRFALFFLSEYAGMITTSCVCVALFFGGWHLPGLHTLMQKVGLSEPIQGASTSVTTSFIECFIRTGVFFAKAIVILFVFMWVRWSLPRFRFDQLMRLAWAGLIPIAIGLLVATAIVTWATGGASFTELTGGKALIYGASNFVVLILVLVFRAIAGAPASTNKRIGIPGSRFNPQAG